MKQLTLSLLYLALLYINPSNTMVNGDDVKTETQKLQPESIKTSPEFEEPQTEAKAKVTLPEIEEPPITEGETTPFLSDYEELKEDTIGIAVLFCASILPPGKPWKTCWSVNPTPIEEKEYSAIVFSIESQEGELLNTKLVSKLSANEYMPKEGGSFYRLLSDIKKQEQPHKEVANDIRLLESVNWLLHKKGCNRTKLLSKIFPNTNKDIFKGEGKYSVSEFRKLKSHGLDFDLSVKEKTTQLRKFKDFVITTIQSQDDTQSPKNDIPEKAGECSTMTDV